MGTLIIRKRRIRKLGGYLGQVDTSKALVIGIPVTPERMDRLRQLGFDQMSHGETVLPLVVGPITRYNAEGKFISHRDQPKETLYRTFEWSHREFHGDQEHEVTNWVDIPYQRYPRTQVPPPALELTCVQNDAGETLVVAPALAYSEATPEPLLHTINLFLELFHEAHVLTDELQAIVLPQAQRLNWHVLPPGEHPWDRLHEALTPMIEQARQGQRRFLELRLQIIAQYGPTFTAVGQAGFNGYVIFGFPEKNLYVLESGLYGNATYVVTDDWAALSRMTKAELINGDLHRARVVHLKNWFDEIGKLLA